MGLSRGLRIGLQLSFLIAFAVSCSSTPTTVPKNPEEQIKQDNLLGLGLSPAFEKELKFRRDQQVSTYLAKLSKRLLGSSSLRSTPIQVKLVRSGKRTWRNYSLPGIRIYIAAEFLRQVQYENELAAALAFELAHISNRHMLKKIEEKYPDMEKAKKIQVRPFGSGQEYLKFKPVELEQSVETAINFLYQAGYDSRGLVAMWKLYQKNPKASPYSKKVLNVLVNKTYRTIVNYTPLRNPIVRSDEFLRIQKRIRRL